jgi:hypothetical protein
MDGSFALAFEASYRWFVIPQRVVGVDLKLFLFLCL